MGKYAMYTDVRREYEDWEAAVRRSLDWFEKMTDDGKSAFAAQARGMVKMVVLVETELDQKIVNQVLLIASRYNVQQRLVASKLLQIGLGYI